MIVWLGMYDLPALQAANDRFWAAIRARLGEGPASLRRDIHTWEVWQSPDMLLAQTCGLPFRARLHEKVSLVGTPDYDLPGCPPGHYNSALVVRADDPRATLADFPHARFAFNDALSQSGWAAPWAHFQAAGVEIGPRLETGSHAASATAVAEGRADIAALDALTWTLLREHHPELTAGLRELDRTAPTPVLPYITAAGRDPAPLAKAITGAIDDLSPDDRALLHLRGLVQIPAEAYLALPIPPRP